MIFCLILAAAIVLADQISKLIVLNTLPAEGDAFEVIKGVFSFCHVENRGALAGSFADQRWVFMSVSAIAIVVIVLYLWKEKPKSLWLKIPLGFILGGGIGNMIDRVFRKSVVDFLNCEFLPFPQFSFQGGFSVTVTDFPVFNIADCFITVGCVMMVVYLMLVELPHEIKEERAKKASLSEEKGSDDLSDTDNDRNTEE